VTIKHLTRLPKVGAAFLWAAVQPLGLVLPLYVLGSGCIVAGVWEGSPPWGKAALGIAILVTALIIARIRR
jgi:hypothetical protein